MEDEMTTPNISGPALASGQAILASVIRTVTPLLVGVLVKGLGHINVVLDSVTAEAFVNSLITAGISIAYYIIVRLLEVLKSSKFGWLLLYAKAAPVYLQPAAVANVVQDGAAPDGPQI
jgi:hypothetical protein